jgi:hypothetical protein
MYIPEPIMGFIPISRIPLGMDFVIWFTPTEVTGVAVFGSPAHNGANDLRPATAVIAFKHLPDGFLREPRNVILFDWRLGMESFRLWSNG